MSNEDKMNIDERRKYLRRMKKRYVQADRKEQGRLLDEMKPTSNCQPTVPESRVRGVVGVRVFADAPLPMVDMVLLDFHLHQFDLTDYLVLYFPLSWLFEPFLTTL